MAAGPTGGSGGAQTAWVLNLLTDLAFNLLIFFVVCASNEPDTKGRPQQVPSADKEKANEQKPQNIEVTITRTTVAVNKEEVPLAGLTANLQGKLAGKNKPEDRIVVVKSATDTPYSQWILVTGRIEQAGGVITLELEEEKEVRVK
ncbi:MAG: Biopolymer transport protein ExbD/TolR [Gemmataceae bacterium]|nr:Biopolymer transport protein ExbD/TolR [Gemmataceae bacterium]